MKRYRFELQCTLDMKIEVVFVQANNLLEASRLAEKEHYKTVCVWQVPL